MDPVPKSRSRRTALIAAGRARRRTESALIAEIGQLLPLDSITPPQVRGKPLDKGSVLRVAGAYMRLRRVVAELGIGGATVLAPWRSAPANVWQEALAGVGAFLLVIGAGDGLTTYVDGPGVLQVLGYSALELLGKPVAEWTHPEDHNALWKLIQASSSHPRRSILRFRLSSLRSSRLEYRAFQLSGRFFSRPGNFVGLAEPLPSQPHPNDFTLPFFAWSDEQVYTTFVSPNLKCATYSFLDRIPLESQRAIERFTGFDFKRDVYVCGLSCFEMVHPEDLPRFAGLAKARKLEFCRFLVPENEVFFVSFLARLAVTAKGTAAGEFRCLRKYGGYVHVYSQGTLVDARGRVTTVVNRAMALIVRHHVLNVVEAEEVVAEVQACARLDDVIVADPPREATPEYPLEYVPSPTTTGAHLDMDLVPDDEMDTLDKFLSLQASSFLDCVQAPSPIC